MNCINKWPDWEKPYEDDVYELIKLSLRYVKFLNPDIIQKIVEDNTNHNEEWRSKLVNNKIDPDIYLWEKSPCAFPGIRRYSGSKEIAIFRKQREMTSARISNALRLDDNDFPKQIWSFTFLGKKFPKKGPREYALAHLADHKNYKNRASDEFVITEPQKVKELFGLFTCPTNTIFIPTNLIRPTDFSAKIRRILVYKAFDLYGDFCHLFPLWISLLPETDDKWHHSEFLWSDPVGTLDNIKAFLQFRNFIMDQLG